MQSDLGRRDLRYLTVFILCFVLVQVREHVTDDVISEPHLSGVISFIYQRRQNGGWNIAIVKKICLGSAEIAPTKRSCNQTSHKLPLFFNCLAKTISKSQIQQNALKTKGKHKFKNFKDKFFQVIQKLV